MAWCYKYIEQWMAKYKYPPTLLLTVLTVCRMHTGQSAVQNNKYQVSHKYSCSSWWWTWRGPKHVEVIIKLTKCTERNCAPSWFHLQVNFILKWRVGQANTSVLATYFPVLTYRINLISVVPCIMLYSGEMSPTRCNNCDFYSHWLYSTCFGWQSHPSSGVQCCIWPQVSWLT